MKKSAMLIPLIITALFVSFMLGMFVGRNFNHGQILTSRFQMDEPSLSDMRPQESTGNNYPVNINTADVTTLCSLPGVGEVLAGRIIDFRNAHGPFKHLEELLMVDGMGPQTFENMIDLITIGG